MRNFMLIINFRMGSGNRAYFNTKERAEAVFDSIQANLEKLDKFNRNEEKTLAFESDDGTKFVVVLADIVSTVIEDLEANVKNGTETLLSDARASKKLKEAAEKEGLLPFFNFKPAVGAETTPKTAEVDTQ